MFRQNFFSGYVDLHVHTTCSDGTFSPEEVVRMAAGEQIKILAITDHENVSGIHRAKKEAQKYGIKVIPGIECDTTFSTGNRHILGYNINPECEAIKKYARISQEDRVGKIYRMLENLGKLGFKLSFEDVKKFSKDGSIGRPHIAQALLEKGYVSSIGEAFDKYIGKGCPGYASRRFVSPEEVIGVIKAAGGIPVLAHPFQMNLPNVQATRNEIKHLMELGIEGTEVIYPQHDANQNYSLTTFAMDNDLFVTCGSDFHGSVKKIQLGRCFFNKKKVTVDGLKKMGKTFV